MGALLHPKKPIFYSEFAELIYLALDGIFATDPKPNIFPQNKNGWRKEKNQYGVETYILHWFDEGMIPENLEEAFGTDPQKEEDEEKQEEEEKE